MIGFYGKIVDVDKILKRKNKSTDKFIDMGGTIWIGKGTELFLLFT